MKVDSVVHDSWLVVRAWKTSFLTFQKLIEKFYRQLAMNCQLQTELIQIDSFASIQRFLTLGCQTILTTEPTENFSGYCFYNFTYLKTRRNARYE